jgi:hypothetical protein
MAHLFLVRDGTEYLKFTKYEDILESFDNVIRFEPEIPPEPHTEKQHEEIQKWPGRLKELMKRERN